MDLTDRKNRTEFRVYNPYFDWQGFEDKDYITGKNDIYSCQIANENEKDLLKERYILIHNFFEGIHKDKRESATTLNQI